MQKFSPALVGLLLLIIVGDNVKTAAAKTKDSDKEKHFGIIKEMKDHMAIMAKSSASEMKELHASNADLRATIADLRATNAAQRKTNKEMRQENRLMKKQAVAKRQDADVQPSSTNGSLHTPYVDFARFCKKDIPICSPNLQLFNTQKSWPEARAFCKKNGGDLASFVDPKLLPRALKFIFPIPTVLPYPSPLNIWIGGSHPKNYKCDRRVLLGPWKWVTGEDLPLSYPYWYEDEYEYEPFVTDQCCLNIYYPGKPNVLFSEQCTKKFAFVCQF